MARSTQFPRLANHLTLTTCALPLLLHLCLDGSTSFFDSPVIVYFVRPLPCYPFRSLYLTLSFPHSASLWKVPNGEQEQEE